MKQIAPTFLLGGMFVLLLSGCISPPKAEFIPPEGILFSNYKAPLLIDYDQTEINSDSGKASCSAFHDILITLMSFGWGDCSIDEATQNGRLNRIGVADYEYLSFLRIYGKTTVHVYKAPTNVSKKQ